MGNVVDLDRGRAKKTASSSRRRRPRRSKTALVLGGGWFTGAVYEIGALRALDLLSVNRTVNQFDIYVGTSAGSFVASLCARSEEHTSELQSRQYLVCRLLLEKKKKNPLHILQTLLFLLLHSPSAL